MIALFRAFSLRYLVRRKRRFLLSGASVVLAVALFVSMRVTETSILASFAASVEALSGKAEAVVTRGVGVDAAALAVIERVPGVRAAPVIQEIALAPEGDVQLMVLGIDFVRDAKLRAYRLDASGEVDFAALLLRPDAILLPRALARERGLAIGGRLVLQTRLGQQPFTVAGIFADEGPARALGGRMIVMGVATAQRCFGRKSRYDRIEVAFEGATPDALRAALGPDYTVAPVPRTNPVLDYQLTQLRLVLFGVSVLAMLIGAFIIFNSLSLSVVERTKEIGILRALGARRREIVGAIALEAALVGTAASVLGVLVGIAMSRTVLAHVAGFVNLFVRVVEPGIVSVPRDVWILAVGVGLSVALAGGIVPALAAARVPPMVAIRSAAYERGLARSYRAPFVFGLLFFAGSMGTGALPGVGREGIMLALVCGVGGIALALPQLILAFSGLVRLLARRYLGVEGTLAVESIVQHPVRTSLTVMAFAGSLSVIVSVWGALASFEGAVSSWLTSIMPWDLTIQMRDLSAGVYSTSTFPGSLLGEMEGDPRVERAYGVRVAFAPFRTETVMVLAIDMAAFMELRRESGRLSDPAIADVWIRELTGGAAVISENFAVLHGVRPGEEIEVGAPNGRTRFRVVDTMEDYSWPRGVVLVDRNVFRERWDDDGLTYLDLRLRPGVDREEARRDFARALQGRYRAYVYETREILDGARAVVREWFRLADAQILLAVAIGGLGVVNTMLISLITRVRQIGILRAVGASPGQIQLSLAFEAACVGLFSGIMGCAMGLFVVKFPLNWLTLQGSGYRLPFVLPWDGLAVSLVGGIVIGTLASLVPMRWVNRIDVVEAIGYE